MLPTGNTNRDKKVGSFIPDGATNRDKRRSFCPGWCLQPGQKTSVPPYPAGPASRWTRDKSHLLSRAQRQSGQMAWNKDLFCSSGWVPVIKIKYVHVQSILSSIISTVPFISNLILFYLMGPGTCSVGYVKRANQMAPLQSHDYLDHLVRTTGTS